jgi:Uma2 family endonuclease
VGFGVTTGEVGVVLRRNPDCVVGPDATFISKTRLPIKRTPEGYLETIPDLVVEVVSKNDTRRYLERKTNDYLRAGVAIVWLVDPAKRTLRNIRPAKNRARSTSPPRSSCRI